MYDALGELERLADTFTARPLSALVFAFEPDKIKSRLFRQVRNFLVGPLESIVCVADGTRE
jgi:hypothetical protein